MTGDPKSIYVIRDQYGKIWNERCSFNKLDLIVVFSRSKHLEVNIDEFDAQQIWKIYEKNGYAVDEIGLEKTEND